MSNILSVQTHNIRNIFLKAGKTTTLFLFCLAKISSKKVCEKLENNSMLKKVLLVCNRNAKLLRLVGATFESTVASRRSMRKKNLIILKSLQKKFVCPCWHLSCQISTESDRKIVMWQCCILSFTQYYNNLLIYCAIWNYIRNIDLNKGVYWSFRNQGAYLYRDNQ